MTINIEARHLKILKEVLTNFNYNFYIFGSRITPKARKFSDLDLLYFEEIPLNVLLQLEEALEESDLPYKVDLVNYHKCDESFKKIIGKNYICIKEFTGNK